MEISSARVATGNSPRISGWLRTRLWRRPVMNPRPGLPVPGRLWAASGNIDPPGESRLPVRAQITSVAHDASVPNATVLVPMRPYTAAVGAAASSAARRTTVSASMPVTEATHSAVNGATWAASSSRPLRWLARVPGSTALATNSWWMMPASRAASVPGRMGRCSSAMSAVRVRLGSTTTTLPPRSLMALSRPAKSGAVHRLPLDSSGLAPSMSR